MVEILLPADVEVAVVNELKSTLAVESSVSGVTVGTMIPATLPNDFVRVIATGGAGRDLVTDKHLVTVEAFSTRQGSAQRVCAFAVALLQACARKGRMGGVTCYRVDVGGLPANLPFPGTPKHFRFTATLQADLRRTAV